MIRLSLFFLCMTLVRTLAYTFPTATSPAWMDEQIREDLHYFQESKIPTTTIDSLLRKYGTRLNLVKITIINGGVSTQMASPVDEGGMFRIQAIARAFQVIADLAMVPDVEFLFSWHDALDGVSALLDSENFPVPIFVFAKNKGSSPRFVLIPDFEIVLDNSKLINDTLKGNALYPWEKKQAKAFWRGAMTGGEFTFDNFLSFPRSKAITASLNSPHLIDARFVGLAQCNDLHCHKIEEIHKKYYGQYVSVPNQIQYKYQLLIDGNSCAYSRCFWQLLSNCVILKQESKAIQWYYRCLRPYEHYVPIAEDLHDIEEAVLWALNHDGECQAMSQRAQAFAKENLSRDQVLQYMYLLILEYAKLQK